MAMSIGTAVGCMATFSMLLVAIVAAIWLEARMPDQREERLRATRPVTPPAPGHSTRLTDPRNRPSARPT